MLVGIQPVIGHIVEYGETVTNVRVGLRPTSPIWRCPCIAADVRTTYDIGAESGSDIPYGPCAVRIDIYVVRVVEIIVIDVVSC